MVSIGQGDYPKNTPSGLGSVMDRERFSRRTRQVDGGLQLADLDSRTRTRVYNLMTWAVFRYYEERPWLGIKLLSPASAVERFFASLYDAVLAEPLMPGTVHVAQVRKRIRSFLMEAEWHKVYDFLEHCYRTYPFENLREEYTDRVNCIMRDENTAYRLLDGDFIPIISDEEIQEVQEAVGADAEDPVSIHLRTALERLSDREALTTATPSRSQLAPWKPYVSRLVGSGPRRSVRRWTRSRQQLASRSMGLCGRRSRSSMATRVTPAASGMR